MKRGLVIGKFMPVHTGHLALISFAAGKCDELIVSMSYTEDDVIPATKRFQWLKELLADKSNTTCYLIKDDFDDESLPLAERTKLWAKKMNTVYPPFDVVFSSEAYGAPFAQNLGALHVSFDPLRNDIPVSATFIRTKPFTYWQFIPENVRPYFVKRICFFGPESTGKTYMASSMAALYNTQWVPEAARTLLTSNEFTETDIVHIAITQQQDLFSKLASANKLLFCDTDVITTQIYAQHYFATIPQLLFDIEQQTPYDLYFLMNIDVPWIADSLRDMGHQRAEMMQRFTSALEQRKIHYVFISGSYAERERKVIETIDALLNSF